MLRINIFIFPLADREYPIILTMFRHRFHQRLLRRSYYYTHISHSNSTCMCGAVRIFSSNIYSYSCRFLRTVVYRN